MHPCVKQFCKVALQYEHQQKKRFADTFIDKLKPILDEDEIEKVKKTTKYRLCKQQRNINKIVLQNTIDEHQKIHNKNIMKYLIIELKANMPHTTILQKRHSIAQKVMNEINNNSCSLKEARNKIYKQHGISIMYEVKSQDRKTTEENMHVERDYNEFSGKIVYGWDNDGEALYHPTFGANIDGPTYKKAGPMWRELLELRWEQKSFFEENESLDDYRGY
jgi:hypothetical protein